MQTKRIIDILKTDNVGISCELFPPKQGTELQNSLEIVNKIAQVHPSYMSVTYGAGGSTVGYSAALAKEVQDNDIPALAHLTCVKADEEKIKGVLDQLKSNGIENILALRGDIPAGMEKDAMGSFAHASDLMYKWRNEIAERARYRLVDKDTGEPIRVVEHIGCHYSKMFPHKGIGGAEYPCVLSGMINSWGGEMVDYPERRHCCGFGFRQYLVKANRGYSISNTHKKFESMEPYHPDMIITNCPGCPYFLDRWQYVIAEMEGRTYGRDGFGIPVFTYEEVAGLVMGYDPWDLGLQLHQVAVEPLLDKIGIEYDPKAKYLGLNRKDIMKPELPKGLRCF